MMLITTTDTLQDRSIVEYKGVVSGEVVAGANVVRDWLASLRDFWGGRSGAYEEVLANARQIALQEMAEEARNLGANAVIGVDIKYHTAAGRGMLMVLANGTAVKVSG